MERPLTYQLHSPGLTFRHTVQFVIKGGLAYIGHFTQCLVTGEPGVEPSWKPMGLEEARELWVEYTRFYGYSYRGL